MSDGDRLRDVAKKVLGWQTLRPERLEAMTADRITVLFDLYGYRTLDVDAVRTTTYWTCARLVARRDDVFQFLQLGRRPRLWVGWHLITGGPGAFGAADPGRAGVVDC